jgi:ubiquinone/menaquinone biosynthesis C-methylase UbiE
MGIPIHPRREKASTYIVQDRFRQEELKRLQLQEQMMMHALGGPLSEQPDSARFQCVLDIACGTGGWLIEMAKAYPTIPRLIGVDISKRTVDYARAQAETAQVNDRVEFYVMDALQGLALPPDFCDLVNLRFAVTFLRAWEWTRVLRESRRLLRPGGVIRVTEADLPTRSSSPALLSLLCLLARAFSGAGNYFHSEAKGISSELTGLLERHGFQQVQARVYTPEVNANTLVGQLFIEDMKYLFRTAAPFIRKWAHVHGDYDRLYRQMLQEMQQPDFEVDSQSAVVWGLKLSRVIDLPVQAQVEV